MKYVLDSYSWIEYFEGTNEGRKVREILENSKNEIFTNILNIAELSNYVRNENHIF